LSGTTLPEGAGREFSPEPVAVVDVRIHSGGPGKGLVEPKNGAKRIRTADLLDSAVKVAHAPLTAS